MKETEFKKLRYTFIKKIYSLNKNIRVQDFERTKGSSESKDIRHYLLHNILTKGKSKFTLLSHNELLRYPIENNSLTEIRFDLDYNKGTLQENIKRNIELGEKIYLKLKDKGFQGFFYYSGGKGVHCSFLLSTKGLEFKQDIENINLNDYETQFIQGVGVEVDKINKSNIERSIFKKCFYQWLNLDKEILKELDFQMCSSKTLLTLEGAKKRKQGSKFKTYLDYSKYNSKELFNYVNSEYKPYIEFKFLTQIQTLSEAQIKEIYSFMSNDIKQTEIKPIIPKENNKSFESRELNSKEKALTLTFVNLYKKNSESVNVNDYSYYISKVSYMILENSLSSKLVLNKFIEITNKDKSKNYISNQVDRAKQFLLNNPNYHPYKFKDLISKDDFIREYNNNYNIFKSAN